MTPEVLALRIGKTAEGEVTLSMYKSAMLAALRSMLPKIPGAQLILIQILQHCMDKPNIFPSFHLHHSICIIPFGSSANIAVVVLCCTSGSPVGAWNLRSPRTWDPHHETAWNWLWEIVDKHPCSNWFGYVWMCAAFVY